MNGHDDVERLRARIAAIVALLREVAAEIEDKPEAYPDMPDLARIRAAIDAVEDAGGI